MYFNSHHQPHERKCVLILTNYNYSAKMLVVKLLLSSMISRVALTSQPNIVFIIADDYGWNDIGYHGSEIQTPNLDKLAGNGVKLENYYVQPICTPSRSQLMSGNK